MSTFFDEDITKRYSELIQTKYNNYTFEIVKGRITRLINSQISRTCHSINDSISIGKQYISELLKKSLLHVGKDFEVVNGYEIMVMKQGDVWCGFMIVKQGLCGVYPEVFVKTLTCSSCSGGGTLFMGLYLYTILENPMVRSKIGMLEVGGAYMNQVAVCLNEKFGFKADTSLFGETCFDDPNNLPMKLCWEYIH